MFFMFAVCLVLAVPVYFVCRWVARKFFNDPALLKIFPWAATAVITPAICCSCVFLFYIAFGGDRSYSLPDFDADQWACGPDYRFPMTFHLIASDTLRGMNRIQVRRLLGKPDLDAADSVWSYSIGGDKDQLLDVKFRRGRVVAVESFYESRAYELNE